MISIPALSALTFAPRRTPPHALRYSRGEAQFHPRRVRQAVSAEIKEVKRVRVRLDDLTLTEIVILWSMSI
jgi:hypothetical protein